jgi:hypothetical protein
MRYIRSTTWDAGWIGGGFMIGIVLVCVSLMLPHPDQKQLISLGDWAFWSRRLSDNVMIVVFIIFIVLDTAHITSPMVMTITDQRMRREALSRWRQFLLLPALVGSIAIVIGVLCSFGWTDYVPGNYKMYYIGYQWRFYEPLPLRGFHAVWDAINTPMPLLMMAYFAWQIWHFGSQHYGLLVIYLHKNDRIIRWRRLTKGLCVALTAPFMLIMPLTIFRVPQGYVPGHDLLLLIPPWVSLLLLGFISVTHWLTALGLSTLVSRIKGWLPFILLVGVTGLLWQAAQPGGMVWRNEPWVAGIAIALSFTHYIYDALWWHRGTLAMQRVVTPTP